MVAPLLPKNGRYLEDPHIGHLYSIVVADTMTRWQRFMGHEAFFMTGTDEHGLKIQTSAAKKNIPAREFCDLVSGRFRDLVEKSNSKADDFIRTTEDRHVRAVTELWKVLKDRGFIYKGSHEGWYSTSDESEDSLAPPCCAKPHCFRLQTLVAFFAETQTTRNANGDRVSVETGNLVEWVSEENYKFALSRCQDLIKNWITENPNAIYPKSKTSFLLNMVKNEMQDLSVSRLSSKVDFPPGAFCVSDSLFSSQNCFFFSSFFAIRSNGGSRSLVMQITPSTSGLMPLQII